MKRFTFFVAVLMFAFSGIPSLASTSFAVYSDKPLYGVNLDINESDIVFRVIKNGDLKTFFIEIPGEMLIENGNGYKTSVSMNDQGLFESNQVLVPAKNYKISQTASTLDIGELALESTFQCTSVEEVLNLIGDKQLVNTEISLHTLYADKTGRAIIVEAGDQNKITEAEDGFLLMADLSADEASGAADPSSAGEKERYDAACQEIILNRDIFDVSKGFDMLKNAAQSWREGGTICSMILDPEAGDVYIALNRDFGRIWKLSIGRGIIETWNGFDKHSSINIGTGVSIKDLITPKTFLQKYGIYLAALLVIIVWATLGTYIRRLKIKRFKPKEMEW